MIRSLEVLASSELPKVGQWLGFRRNYSQLGAFTDLNQLMLPRSQCSSTSVTFRMPCGSPLGMMILATLEIVSNRSVLALDICRFTPVKQNLSLQTPCPAHRLLWWAGYSHVILRLKFFSSGYLVVPC